MKLKVIRENDDITAKLIIDGKETAFDYVCLINQLYDNDLIDDEIEFSENIEDWEKEEIKNLVCEINDVVDSAKKTNESEEK